MINFKYWPVRFKLIVPLLLVMILGSGGIIFAFSNMFGKITLVELPEERALNGIHHASLQLLAEYREFMVTPRNSTLREISELKEELEGIGASFEHSMGYHTNFAADIEAGVQNLIAGGDAAIGLRRRLLRQVRSLELFEASFESLPARNRFAVEAEGTGIEEAGATLEKILQAGSGGAASDEYTRIQQVLEVGHAIVSLSGEFLTALDELEEREEILSGALAEATAFVAQETDTSFATGFMQVAAVILAVLLLITAVGYLVSQRIARPVMILADAANRLGGGDLSVRADVASADEIGKLAAAFNQMAENLQSNVELREQAEEHRRRGARFQ
jgi:nitrogen fixation/metabolism regulation signal transduction histidine kinase